MFNKPASVPGKNVRAYRGRALQSQAHFGSTVPGKNIRAYRGRALQRWPNFYLFLFLFFRGQYFHIVIFP
jgi:hypothetical protein